MRYLVPIWFNSFSHRQYFKKSTAMTTHNHRIATSEHALTRKAVATENEAEAEQGAIRRI